MLILHFVFSFTLRTKLTEHTRMSSISRSKKQKTFTIRKDPTLFLETRKYHSRAMKRLFLKHYQPLSTTGKRNKKWTLNVSLSDMYDLRVHLSWVIGIKVFKWSNEMIGRKILRVYKQSGELKFLTNVVVQNNL